MASSWSIPLVGLVDEFLRLDGSGTSEMRINGASTPRVFKFEPGTDDVEIQQMIFVGEAGTIDFGNKFLGLANLTNGCFVEAKADDVTYTLGNLQVTRDFAHFADYQFQVFVSGQDMMRALRTLPPGFVLRKAGTYSAPDCIRVTIRDDLAGVGLTSLRCRVQGVKL